MEKRKISSSDSSSSCLDVTLPEQTPGSFSPGIHVIGTIFLSSEVFREFSDQFKKFNTNHKAGELSPGIIIKTIDHSHSISFDIGDFKQTTMTCKMCNVVIPLSHMYCALCQRIISEGNEKKEAEKKNLPPPSVEEAKVYFAAAKYDSCDEGYERMARVFFDNQDKELEEIGRNVLKKARIVNSEDELIDVNGLKKMFDKTSRYFDEEDEAEKWIAALRKEYDDEEDKELSDEAEEEKRIDALEQEYQDNLHRDAGV